jgi:hypothetical protein
MEIIKLEQGLFCCDDRPAPGKKLRYIHVRLSPHIC